MLAAPVRWPRPSRLREPLKAQKGKAGEAMTALGLHTVGDLLEHLPRDRREARAVAQLQVGEQATVAVQVRSISSRPVRRRGMRGLVEATVFDASGSMRATFFNQPWLVDRYPAGARVVLHGKADRGGRFRVSHHAPGAEIGSEEGEVQSVAHYPATEGISSTQLLTLVREARHGLREVPEPLTAPVRVADGLPDRAAALAAIHFASAGEEARSGLRRLAFDELLLTQLAFLVRRGRRAEHVRARPLRDPPTLSGRWLEQSLPFEPTGDQRAAIATIGGDLERGTPMQRLLMGEVGSGKTVVALWAMLRAVEHGAQAALMAPTETLAEQHFATLQRLLGGEPVAVALLTGSTPASRRADTLGKLASGELSLIVGTHALIEPDVRFRELVVAVVDEQHRFGVRQRGALEAKGDPHTLHMTATPIPRTLALARHGDLDRSVLRELPKGRQAIDTRIVAGEEGRLDAYRLLREQLDSGRQAYVVCPLVEDGTDSATAGSSASEARAATSEFERLAAPRAGWAASGAAARADAPARKAAGDGGVRLRTGRSTGGDDRDRGGGGCAKRHGHARRERRAFRHLTAAPAPRARGAGGARLDLPARRPARLGASAGARGALRRVSPRRDRPALAQGGRADRHAPIRARSVQVREHSPTTPSCSSGRVRGQRRSCARTPS